MERREYKISIIVNDKRYSKVIVDPHYEQKHAEYMTDELILALVKTLDGEEHEPQSDSPPYSYFVKDRIRVKDKFYKLVWVCEKDQIYVGVINAYRR